jgi:phosphoglycolate phosphatase-like HAD superfamily hydrolase
MIGRSMENPMRRLIMFDLDGTLVHTSSEDALFVEAMKTWLNIDTVNSDWNSYEHVTDAGIATELYLRHRQRLPQPNELDTACDLFFQQWIKKLIQDRSACIPVDGASQLLRKVLGEINLSMAIATGGWEKTACLKLTHAQLPFQGIAMASSNDVLAREDIMQRAYERAAAKAGVLGFDGVVYIGDGPWDLAAAQNLGYGFVGISAADRREMLLSKGADQVISDFCNIEHVIQLILQEAKPGNH